MLGKVARLGAIGVVAGATLSYPLVGLVRKAIFGVGDLPVSSVVFVGLVVLGSSLVAGGVPVWRAVRTEPSAVLSE